jgi:hypothetical protein
MKNCPYCNTPSPDNAKFCQNCGGNLVDRPAQETPPPDPSFGGTPAAAPPAAPAAPPAAAPAPAPFPQPPPGEPQVRPPKKSNTGCIIAVIVLGIAAVFVAIFAVAIGGAFIFATRARPTIATPTSPSAKGFATAQEAVKDQIDPTWAVKTESESSDDATILAGPPASEYVTVYTVEKDPDGLWRVKEVKFYEP